MTRYSTLLTCFEPFGGESENASRVMVAKLLEGMAERGKIETLCLPVEYGPVSGLLSQALHRLKPRIVIAFGEAPITGFRLETQAFNWDCSPKPDNQGRIRTGSVIDPGSPGRYRSTLPLRGMLGALKAADVPAEASYSAGGYLCNHVFYRLMHEAPPECRIRGFVHVPKKPAGSKWTYESWGEWAKPALRLILDEAREADLREPPVDR
jgi:pyroglutamyl-peptidase